MRRTARWLLTINGKLPPLAPSNLSVGSATTSALTLTWSDNSSNETGFEIERSPNGTDTWTLIHTTAANATSYENTGLSSDTAYYYRVRAVNDDGESAYTDVANGTTLAQVPEMVTGHTKVQDTSAQTTRNISVPTHAAGDQIFIAVVGSVSSGSTPNVAVSGFTAPVYNNPSPPTQFNLYVFQKTAGGSEGSTYAITSASGLVSAIAWAVRYYGGIDVSSSVTVGLGTTATAPEIITTVDDTLRVSVIGVDDNPGVNSISTLATHNLLDAFAVLARPGISVQYKDLPSAGTAGAETATLGASETWAGISFAIKG